MHIVKILTIIIVSFVSINTYSKTIKVIVKWKNELNIQDVKLLGYKTNSNKNKYNVNIIPIKFDNSVYFVIQNVSRDNKITEITIKLYIDKIDMPIVRKYNIYSDYTDETNIIRIKINSINTQYANDVYIFNPELLTYGTVVKTFFAGFVSGYLYSKL
jgi:hypothetical protein